MWSIRRACALLALLIATPASAQLVPLPPQAASTPWPTHSWPTAPLPAAVDAAAFQALLGAAFDQTDKNLGETRAVVVIQGGHLVHEQYLAGFTAETRLVSWSMAKSITHALVGRAVQQGRIDVDKPMGNPHWSASDPRSRISWRTWLQMTDGMRYVELQATSIGDSDAARKLFGPGRLDVASYCAGLPLIHEPGKHWNYNSCGIVLIADALTRTIVPNPVSSTARRAAMQAWIKSSLFDRLGMRAQPEFDAAGLFYGSAFVYATARDFAKFGLLYLRDGIWEGERLLPEGWVDFARSPASGSDANIYGAGWWITPREGSGTPLPVRIDTGPERDPFSAQGFEGQCTLVVPSKDLVIVRLGLTTPEQLSTHGIFVWLGGMARTFPSLQP